MSRAAALAAVTLPNPNGITTRLGTLWEQSAAVLVLLPDWSLPASRLQLATLRDEEERFRLAGARIAAVGLGDRQQVRAAREAVGARFPVLVDEERLAYRTAGLAELSLVDLLQPGNVLAGLAALGAGSVPSLQRGGVFLFAPPNVERFARTDAGLGEPLPVAALREALGA